MAATRIARRPRGAVVAVVAGVGAFLPFVTVPPAAGSAVRPVAQPRAVTVRAGDVRVAATSLSGPAVAHLPDGGPFGQALLLRPVPDDPPDPGSVDPDDSAGPGGPSGDGDGGPGDMPPYGNGGPSPSPCRPKTFFRIDSYTARNIFLPGTHYVDGPGGTVKVWVKEWHLVRTIVRLEKEVEHEYSVDDLIVRLRRKIGHEVEEENAVETGHEYTVTVKKDKWGHLRYRVFGYRVGFQLWRRQADCGVRFLTHGTAIVPTSWEGWKFWETDDVDGKSDDDDDDDDHR
ncbi:hypothetical protein [Microbispora sp. NPDC049125]|uniref:hypothetical protein n=1 Tax=Microbispora sp. NPDC049125 TaxID=3154929 RepID=UPI00346555EA